MRRVLFTPSPAPPLPRQGGRSRQSEVMPSSIGDTKRQSQHSESQERLKAERGRRMFYTYLLHLQVPKYMTIYHWCSICLLQVFLTSRQSNEESITCYTLSNSAVVNREADNRHILRHVE